MLASLALLSLSSPAHAFDEAMFRGLDIAVQEELVSEARVALVIGNAAYEKGELLNPERDARAIAARLEDLGFDTILGLNLTQNEMIVAIQEFGERLEAGGTGLFYFAGHGMQVDGENYLIPIGANIRKEPHVETESVAVSRVLAQMEGAENRMNLLILDACRNNPYEARFRSTGGGGLSSIDPPRGTWIAFATAPGKLASDGEGAHGVYTQALLDNLGSDVRPLEQTFKSIRTQVMDTTEGEQTPQEYTSVTGEFFFRTPGREAGMRSAPPPTNPDATVAELDDADDEVPQPLPGPLTVDDRKASWGFGTFSPFMQIFVEGPMAPSIGNQGIGIFIAPALALASNPDHGSGVPGTNVVWGLMGGVRVYNRFNLGSDATGFKVSAIATQPLIFADPEDDSAVLIGFGGGVSIDAHLNDVLWVEVGGTLVVDNHAWFIPNLSFGAAF